MNYAMHAGVPGKFDGSPLCGATDTPMMGVIVNPVEVVTCLKCKAALGLTVGPVPAVERDAAMVKAREAGRAGLMRALDGKRSTAAMERARFDLLARALGCAPDTPLEAVVQLAMDLRDAVVAAEYASDAWQQQAHMMREGEP